MDFGLARNTSLSTQDSVEGRGLAGTLAYMAPEQLDGQRAGHAADIYALGVVMYEMLTGQLPFVPEPGEAGLSAVLTRLTDPAPPLRSLIPGIDARWNDLVARCLEREVVRRLASADDIVRALSDEVSVDAPVPPAAAARADAPAAPAAPSARTAPARAPRSAWRRAGLIVAGVGGLVAVVAAIQHRSASPPPAASVAPEQAPATPPAPTTTPPPAEPTVAPPKIATAATPAPSTTAPAPERPTTAAARPEAAAAVDRYAAARRPNAPRPVRRDQTAAAAAPKLGSASPTAPTGAAEKDPPKQAPKPHHRSADPDDGFIFQ
jgi:serine/threonine-protein kinase